MSRILIVDDDEEILELVRNRLENHGYETVTAIDGGEALRKARTQKPDMIVLDVSMPVISGYEVCARLKSDEATRHIPVLILTGHIRYTDKKIAEHCGADGYLPKPYSSEMLLDEIAKNLYNTSESSGQE